MSSNVAQEHAFFLSNDRALWKKRLDVYNTALSMVADKKFAKKPGEADLTKRLDRDLFKTMPEAVAARRVAKQTPLLTKEEIVNIVDWKMHRAKQRPRLLDFAKGNDPFLFKKVVTAAEAEVSKLSSASTRMKAAEKMIKILSEPKGVGPATSLAIGSVLSPQLCFYSDEACESMPDMLGPGGKHVYTEEYALDFMRQMLAKAEKLNGLAKGTDTFVFTPRDLEKALYVNYYIRKKTIPENIVPADEEEDDEESEDGEEEGEDGEEQGEDGEEEGEDGEEEGEEGEESEEDDGGDDKRPAKRQKK
jgi:hypothetical protein